MILILFRLFRPRLAILNGIAATGGYLLAPVEPALVPALTALSGVTLLAAGGSAINQVLERDLDRLMVRTRQRPLPQGDLSPAAVTVIGGGCILAGLLELAVVGGLLPALLGGAALVWYLAIYTPLKRRTPLALAAGGGCGAIPPVIGWCIAGGAPTDYRIILLAGLLYLWQIPHFWLFQRRHADDYRRAGFPLATAGMNVAGSAGLCRLWIAALLAGAMLLPAFGVIETQVARWYALFPLPIAAVALFSSEAALFYCLNFFPIVVTLSLFLQR